MPKKEKNSNPNPMPDPNPKSSGLWVNLRLSEVTIVVAFFGFGSPLLFGSGFPSPNIQIQNVNQNFAGEKPISTSATPKPMPLTLKD